MDPRADHPRPCRKGLWHFVAAVVERQQLAPAEHECRKDLIVERKVDQ